MVYYMMKKLKGKLFKTELIRHHVIKDGSEKV